jgi:hypothetical protein
MCRARLLEHDPEMAQRSGRVQVRPVLLADMPEKGKTSDRPTAITRSVTLIKWALLARFLGQNPAAKQCARRSTFPWAYLGPRPPFLMPPLRRPAKPSLGR